MNNTLSLGGKIRRLAEEEPDRLLVRYGDRAIFANQVVQAMNQVANGLLQSGLQAQSRIALLAKNTPAFYDVMLGCASADMVLVPVNYRLSAQEILFILQDAEAQLVFVSEEYAPVIDEIKASLPLLQKILVIDRAGSSENGHVENSYDAWLAEQGDEHPKVDVPFENTAMQMYTSGTTGQPKGALLTHQNLVAAMVAGANTWELAEGRDVILVCMPQYHIGASIWGLTGLWVGVESILTREFIPPETLRLIEKYRVTKTQLAAVMMRMLLHDPKCAVTDVSSLELIIYGASPCPLELIRRAIEVFGCGIAQGYGMTETAGSITYLDPEDHRNEIGERLISAGRPMEGIEIQVVDESGTPLPVGENGEVCCRGDQVTTGYWNLPEATKKSFDGDWFKTGDVGSFDADGYLYIRDRVKDMIVSGGENIYPAEVESALYEHPAVSDVAVIGVSHQLWGEVPKAIIVLNKDCELTPEQIYEFLDKRLAHYKIPKKAEFVSALPRNASGKVLKQELRKSYGSN